MVEISRKKTHPSLRAVTGQTLIGGIYANPILLFLQHLTEESVLYIEHLGRFHPEDQDGHECGSRHWR